MSYTPPAFALDGRVAVITGGNRDIGRSIALAMARASAAVFLASAAADFITGTTLPVDGGYAVC